MLREYFYSLISKSCLVGLVICGTRSWIEWRYLLWRIIIGWCCEFVDSGFISAILELFFVFFVYIGLTLWPLVVFTWTCLLVQIYSWDFILVWKLVVCYSHWLDSWISFGDCSFEHRVDCHRFALCLIHSFMRTLPFDLRVSSRAIVQVTDIREAHLMHLVDLCSAWLSDEHVWRPTLVRSSESWFLDHSLVDPSHRRFGTLLAGQRLGA